VAEDRSLRVLHVTSEMTPFVKAGGLGDVLGALPKALRRDGVDARALIPAIPGVMERAEAEGFTLKKLPGTLNVALDWRVYSANVWRAEASDGVKMPIYLLGQDELYTNPSIYPDILSHESVLPFVFLSLAALELPAFLGWKPQILHVHDWPTAILPVALKHHHYYKSMAQGYDVILTVHNPAHQGIIDPGILAGWGLEDEAFSLDGLEFYGQANLLKGGLLAADAITTVSPHYSWDIQTQDGGFGLHGVFSSSRHKLTGILNGIDYDVWNPRKDRYLPSGFDAKDLSGKALCRAKLLDIAGMPDDGKPLMTFVGRLVPQKGIDILLPALDWSLVDNCRMVLVGSGLQQYEEMVHEFRRSYPEHFWCFTEFSEELAHLAYAGSDVLVMPSLFEPCGLSQMISMAYGTIPIVRGTGGLADSVIDFDASGDGTGFIFSDYNSDELCQAMYRAFDVFSDHSRWSQVVQNAMRADFSWTTSAKAYIDLYQNLRNGDSLT